MGVYIKGIDLPNSGQIELIIRPHGKVVVKTKGIGKVEAFQISTPLGRMIDANKLADSIATLFELNNKLIDTWLANLIQDEIDDAPTILEAEE